MNEQNRIIWDRVFKTDPARVKKITGKTYQGSSPHPYWLIEQATNIFGACGIGWGVNVINERFEMFGDEHHHFALVEFWYMQDGKRGSIQQMGGTRAAYKTAAGKFMADEDAPKKSVTDAMVKAMSMLGFAGDIFSGRWDDSKYQAELRDEFANEKPQSNAVDQANQLFERAVAAIETAETMDDLIKHFTAATALIVNRAEQDRVVAAKDKRKAFLSSNTQN